MEQMLPPSLRYKFGNNHRDNVVVAKPVDFVDKPQYWPCQLTIRRRENDKFYSEVQLVPTFFQFRCGLLFKIYVNCRHAFGRDRFRVTERTHYAAMNTRDRHDDGILDRFEGVTDPFERELCRNRNIMAMDGHEHKHEQRDHHHNDPRAVNKFRRYENC